MEFLESINYLRNKLNRHSNRVNLRYKCYDMKNDDLTFGITIPAAIRAKYKAIIGWNTKAVDSLADRLVFREFANDEMEFNHIFQMNNPDVFFDSAINSALIASCSFIYISKGDEDTPRLQVIEASNATGIINPITGLLKEGYAVLERDKNNKPILEAYFRPFITVIINNEGRKTTYNEIKHEVGHPLLVPIIHRPDAVRPFGRSRITRGAMYWQQYAKRTLERADVTAEFYSFPQKYILGMDSDAEAFDKWQATIASMLRIDANENGEKPTVGQFQTPSMSPFMEQLRIAASGFAGETGLTLDDLGFVSDNPSSAEAIKASHETLRAMAKKAQRSFSSGLINVGYLACCLRDKMNYERSEFYKIKVKWEPVFEADASTLSLVGDGAIKINQALPGYVTEEKLKDIAGI